MVSFIVSQDDNYILKYYQDDNNQSSMSFDLIGNVPLTEEYISLMKPCELFICKHKHFNYSLDVLPDNITEIIIMSKHFNQKINKTPKLLKTLEFEDTIDFNQPLDCLNNGLEKISFNGCGAFTHPLDNLPLTIHEIQLFGANNMSFPLDNLPYGIKLVNTHARFNQPIDNFPDTVETIVLYEGFKQKIGKLPASIKNIELCSNYPYADEFDLKYPDLDIRYTPFYQDN
jgi:hypothetical protein